MKRYKADSKQIDIELDGQVYGVVVYVTQGEINKFIRDHMSGEDLAQYGDLNWIAYEMRNSIENGDGTTSITFIGCR